MENKLPLPYSIFTENRPLRIIFLVNPTDQNAPQVIQKIIEYNQGRWGGRYNPIIFTDGTEITNEWWEFIKNYDPDIIKSFVSLSTSLLKRMNDNLTPYLIEDFDPVRGGYPPIVYIQDDGLSVLPIKESIAQVTGFSLDRTFLVLFEIDEYQQNEINTFLKINFGTFQPRTTISSIIKEYPKRKEFVIKSETELVAALSSLNTFDTFVYPSLMCTVPSAAINHKYSHEEENFTIIVGDSLNDIVYYWNRIFSVHYTRQTKLNAIWISRNMAQNTAIMNSLNIWIKKAVDPAGTEDHGVRFVSFSMNRDELDQIATQVLNGTFFRKIIDIKDSIPLTNFTWDPNLPGIKDRLHPIRINGDEAYITVPPPDLKEGVMGGQHWMTDVYIEFHPERFTYIQGVDYWWQLPKHNDLAMSLFHTQSRICGNGIPAVLLKRDSFISPYPNNKIKIKLIDDPSIFQILIVGEKRPMYTADPRNSLAQRPYYNTGISDKGRYLSGVLDLFSGLYGAYSFFEKLYWRQMLSILSQQNPRKDEVRKESVVNKLNKELVKRGFNTNSDKEWLAEYILRLSKEQSSSGKELPYLSFKKEAEQEVENYNFKHPQNKHRFSETNLKDELGYLIEAGILSTGIRPRCPACGLSSWYHIDETKQLLKCKGCGYDFGLEPEQTWYYRLNSLIQEGVSRHYLIPVILTLGQLLNDTRSSFIYTTCLNLYDRNSLEKPLGDLDIVCIQDGKFIIGEVKNVCSLFDQSDFDKMEIVAKKIRPNKVIFSTLEQKSSPSVAEKIRNLSEKLKAENIEVKWLKLDYWLFEPSLL